MEQGTKGTKEEVSLSTNIFKNLAAKEIVCTETCKFELLYCNVECGHSSRVT